MTQPKRTLKRSCNQAFTLVELLVVIGILTLLAGILFPVLINSKRKGRETVCVSNLHQIGIAVYAYAQDYDDQLPLGADPLDKLPLNWQDSEFSAIVQAMPSLPDVLLPYTKSKAVWSCPADTGFTMGGLAEEIDFPTSPSSFEMRGSSYYAQTTFVLHHIGLSNFRGYSMNEPYEERSASESIYLYDGSGRWHGGTGIKGTRFGALYMDGHARVENHDTFFHGVAVVSVKPAP